MSSRKIDTRDTCTEARQPGDIQEPCFDGDFAELLEDEGDVGCLGSPEELCICIAEAILGGEPPSPHDMVERRRRVEAALAVDLEDRAVLRGYLAGVVAWFGTTGGAAVQKLATEIPVLGQAMKALAEDPTLAQTADIGLADLIVPRHKVAQDPNSFTWSATQDFYWNIRSYLFESERARFDAEGMGMNRRDVWEANTNAAWGATRAILLLLGTDGLRDILVLEEVHWAIRAQGNLPKEYL